jgi:hypothetical protein
MIDSSHLLGSEADVNTKLDAPVRYRTDRPKVSGNGGRMEAGTTDRRVRRTRERSALLSLIQEKGYDRIKVQDILDRADVGRSTFYAHYRDKDDLLQSGFEDVRAALAAEMQPEASASRGRCSNPRWRCSSMSKGIVTSGDH